MANPLQFPRLPRIFVSAMIKLGGRPHPLMLWLCNGMLFNPEELNMLMRNVTPRRLKYIESLTIKPTQGPAYQLKSVRSDGHGVTYTDVDGHEKAVRWTELHKSPLADPVLWTTLAMWERRVYRLSPPDLTAGAYPEDVTAEDMDIPAVIEACRMIIRNIIQLNNIDGMVLFLRLVCEYFATTGPRVQLANAFTQLYSEFIDAAMPPRTRLVVARKARRVNVKSGIEHDEIEVADMGFWAMASTFTYQKGTGAQNWTLFARLIIPESEYDTPAHMRNQQQPLPFRGAETDSVCVDL